SNPSMAGMEPGPPRRDRICRVPPRHSELAANPMAGMEPGPPRRDRECRVPPRHSALAANPTAGMEPGPPRRDRECRVPPRHSVLAATSRAGREPAPPRRDRRAESPPATASRPQPPWPGWNPALPGATGVSSSTSTQRTGSKPHGRDGTRPSQARPERRVPSRHTELAATPWAGMEPGPPRRDRECRVPPRHSALAEKPHGRDGTRPSKNTEQEEKHAPPPLDTEPRADCRQPDGRLPASGESTVRIIAGRLRPAA